MVTYATPQAFRVALEQRLRDRTAPGVTLDRLRRRVVFERVVARLTSAEPGEWVVKGGMALEVRLPTGARVTKDLDLGLRRIPDGVDQLHAQLAEALAVDRDGDRFEFQVARPVELTSDGGGWSTLRTAVDATLAGRAFHRLQLDVSPRGHELARTEPVRLPNSLAFAGLPDRTIEIVDVHRHAAEKLHAMQRDFGDRDNSRVRDLVDLVLLLDHGLLDPRHVADAVAAVWLERDQAPPPAELSGLPDSWPPRYDALVRDQDLDVPGFEDARRAVAALWAVAVGGTGNR